MTPKQKRAKESLENFGRSRRSPPRKGRAIRNGHNMNARAQHETYLREIASGERK